LPASGEEEEDESIASRASRLDSLNRDDADDDADLQDASAWRRVHCNGGASSTMARWFSVAHREDGGRGKTGEGGGTREEEARV
jgi:hypothetical protein